MTMRLVRRMLSVGAVLGRTIKTSLQAAQADVRVQKAHGSHAACYPMPGYMHWCWLIGVASPELRLLGHAPLVEDGPPCCIAVLS
jgi:hypothetical protein